MEKSEIDIKTSFNSHDVFDLYLIKTHPAVILLGLHYDKLSAFSTSGLTGKATA